MSLQARLDEFRRSGYLAVSEDEIPMMRSVLTALVNKAIEHKEPSSLVHLYQEQLSRLDDLQKKGIANA